MIFLHATFIKNVVSGETLDHVPLLETLDLSWNTGIGGGSLYFLTQHLYVTSSLRELYLLDCQLSEPDSAALGETRPGPTPQHWSSSCLTFKPRFDVIAFFS